MNSRVLLRIGFRLAGRALWSGGRPRRGLLPVTLVTLMAAAFALAFGALFAQVQALLPPRAVPVSLLGWAFTLAVLMLALGDLHAVVSAAITAPDLDRLRAAPLSTTQLLVLKLGETLPRTLPPVLAIALPAALGHGLTHGGIALIPLVVAMLLLWALPLALGTLLALPLLRLAPAPRLREALALLATVAFVAGWLANAFWMPRLAADLTDLRTALVALPPPPAWSPATWAAESLAAEPRRAHEALAACVVALLAAGAATAWAAGELLPAAQARAAAAPGRASRAGARRAPSLAAAFLVRDAALASRDWPVALDALANLALWSLLPLALLPIAPLPHQVLARDMLIALSVSLGHDVAARALPLERASLAWARLSPVGGARWLRMRSLGVVLAGGTFVLLAHALVCRGLDLEGAAALDALVFAAAAATSALATGLCLGAGFGQTSWTDPRAMLGPGGRVVSASVLLAQAGTWVVLAHRLPATPIPPVTALLLLAAAGLVALAALALAALALDRREFSGA